MDMEKEYEKYLNRMAREISLGNIEPDEVKILDFEEYAKEVEDDKARKRRAPQHTR